MERYYSNQHTISDRPALASSSSWATPARSRMLAPETASSRWQVTPAQVGHRVKNYRHVVSSGHIIANPNQVFLGKWRLGSLCLAESSFRSLEIPDRLPCPINGAVPKVVGIW